MKRCKWRGLGAISAALFLAVSLHAAEPPAPVGLEIKNGGKRLALPLVPGVDQFKVFSTPSLSKPFNEAAGTVSGYWWDQPGVGSAEFFRVQMQPKNPATLAAATLLNRIAYGPTPDELERVTQMGPDAYVAEQLSPETIQEELEIDRIQTEGGWQRVTMTGNAKSSKFYIYLTAAGDCYLDDIKLVRGTTAESGVNLMPNGDFENGLTGWTVSPNLTNSMVVTDIKHSGNGALHVVATAEGKSEETSIWRQGLGLTVDQPYTLSYWFRPGARKSGNLVLRLSGSEPGNGIYSSPGSIATRLATAAGDLNDLSAWHVLHAVQSKRQLLEVMLQWLENHFVTQHRKSREYFDGLLGDNEEEAVATHLEYRELSRWRQALLKPNCTFHDLLKISAESPAMIVYLDTVNSRGDGGRIANENYARELLELFTFGVDNGYDQNDITILSRAWTGWSVRLVDEANVFNPFAPQSTTLRPDGTNVTRVSNLEGVWAFTYKAANHYNGEKIIFPGKTVPDRFGAPYAGRNYELKLLPGGGGESGGADWQRFTMTGTASSSTLYIYLTGTGDCYIDDLKIVPGTAPETGVNAVKNGDFESNLTGWTVSPNLSGSTASTTVKHSGNSALHLVSTKGGQSKGDSIWRQDLGLTQGQEYTLSYWYKPGTISSGNLVIRLSGSGLDSSPGGNSTNTIQDGYRVLTHLADLPFTQEYISVKLCRLFVHDDFAHGYDFTDPNLSPEGRLVRDCMQAWEENMPKGQIRKVLEVILKSELFRTQTASMQKVKTPFEFTVSAVRALRALATDGSYTANSDGYSIRSPLNRMGRMRLFDRDDPDGYPEAGAPWISAGTLTERLRFVQALMLPGQNGRADAAGNTADPVKLLKLKLPSTAWNDAAAVADYFNGILFPAEGRANLDDFRKLSVHYLNTADDGVASSPFSALGHTTQNYDLRVRGMVAMLLTFQRFQEQ